MEKLKQEEVLKRVYDTLNHVRGGQGIDLLKHKPIADQIESKVNDLARLLKELEDDNVQLTQKNKKLQDKLTKREDEIQSAIEENEDL